MAAVLATLTAAAALALAAAGPAQALTCAPGYLLAVAGNGAEVCAVSSTGGVPGGGGGSTGGGASTVPGQAQPIAPGGGGAPVMPPAAPVRAHGPVNVAPEGPGDPHHPGRRRLEGIRDRQMLPQ
jgi:hypothetical protein